MGECKFDEFLLHEYLDGTIAPLEKIILEEHLKSCTLCRKELTELKLLMWELESLDEMDIPPDITLLRTKALGELAPAENQGFGIKEFIHVQRNIFRHAALFLEAVPGIKSGAAAIEKGIKDTPSALYKTFDILFKGRERLLTLRERL
ncbi:anti-sigma factor family protein [Thermotalea metallivorans]|uniref:Anti-sigma-W factor RsiW n=1 Tax=Thermotalea metallivorans TaxID=520762 RepID=A0A140KZR4_9FIRM|nr:zf-HC2 domain-containing protein [Thermotalea metallivorans]KXG73789.1 hypothetical protein AN619_28810 [Thermotalea metallivorans]